MEKLYAKLCQELKKRWYVGIDTKYAKTTVDNLNAEISVDFDIQEFLDSVHIEGDKIVLNDD